LTKSCPVYWFHYTISIDKEGVLNKEFGKGFFDESMNIVFERSKL